MVLVVMVAWGTTGTGPGGFEMIRNPIINSWCCVCFWLADGSRAVPAHSDVVFVSYMSVDQNSCILKWTSSPKKIFSQSFANSAFFFRGTCAAAFRSQCRFSKLQGKMWPNWDVKHKNAIKLGCQAHGCDQIGMSSTWMWSNQAVNKDGIKLGCQAPKCCQAEEDEELEPELSSKIS